MRQSVTTLSRSLLKPLFLHACFICRSLLVYLGLFHRSLSIYIGLFYRSLFVLECAESWRASQKIACSKLHGVFELFDVSFQIVGLFYESLLIRVSFIYRFLFIYTGLFSCT